MKCYFCNMEYQKPAHYEWSGEKMHDKTFLIVKEKIELWASRNEGKTICNECEKKLLELIK